MDGVAWEGLTPPFETLPQASVGLFSYSEALSFENNPVTGDSCQAYDDWKDVGETTFWSIAQWGAFLAPILGFLAFLQIVLEVLGLCRLLFSYLVVPLLYFFTFGLQLCTFFVLMETQFW